MLTAAVVPVVTLPMESEFAGPVGPSGKTSESDCDGAVPVIVTAAVVPVLTLPIDREFAGPAGPGSPGSPNPEPFVIEEEEEMTFIHRCVRRRRCL